MKLLSERHSIKDILELSDNPTLEEAKKNYKRLAMQYHPDRNKSPEALDYMKKLNSAYAMVMNEAKRRTQPQMPSRQRTEHIVVVVTYHYPNGASWSWGTGTNADDIF